MKESATPTVQASGLFHRMFGAGVGAGNFLPALKLMVAVLLAAAATFLGLFAVAQAQAANGTIVGLTLTSGMEPSPCRRSRLQGHRNITPKASEYSIR